MIIHHYVTSIVFYGIKIAEVKFLIPCINNCKNCKFWKVKNDDKLKMLQMWHELNVFFFLFFVLH